MYKMLSYRRENALQGALVLAKSGTLELGENISRHYPHKTQFNPWSKMSGAHMGYPYGAQIDAHMGPILDLCRHADWVSIYTTAV